MPFPVRAERRALAKKTAQALAQGAQIRVVSPPGLDAHAVVRIGYRLPCRFFFPAIGQQEAWTFSPRSLCRPVGLYRSRTERSGDPSP
jgi:hypothetical protein